MVDDFKDPMNVLNTMNRCVEWPVESAAESGRSQAVNIKEAWTRRSPRGKRTQTGPFRLLHPIRAWGELKASSISLDG
jgi:hypothetical protein